MKGSIQVIVTGARGFLGRRMSRMLENHFKVVKVDLKGECNERVDLLKEESWDKLDKYVNFPWLFLINLAFINFRHSRMEEKNRIMLENLSQFMDKHSNVFLLYPSTTLVYGAKSSKPVTEDSLPNPESLYARIKLEMENFLLSHFPLRCTIFRITNIYGKGIGENTVIGKIFNQLKRNQRISLKDYNSVRDFIEIDDVIDAFMMMISYIVGFNNLSNKKKQLACLPYSIFNVSTGEAIIIYDLASKFAHYYKKEHLLPEREKVIKRGRNEYLIPLPERLKKLFACGKNLNLNEELWQPVNIDEGIKRIAEH